MSLQLLPDDERTIVPTPVGNRGVDRPRARGASLASSKANRTAWNRGMGVTFPLVVWLTTASPWVVSGLFHLGLGLTFLTLAITRHVLLEPAVQLETRFAHSDDARLEPLSHIEFVSTRRSVEATDETASMLGPHLDPSRPFAVARDNGAGPTRAAAEDSQGGGGGLDLAVSQLNVGFFGTGTAAKSVVYIVDISHSMVGQGRFTKAMTELKRSVGKLTAQQSYHVFLYNDQSFPMFDTKLSPKLQPVTVESRAKLSRWLATKRPTGGTDPTGALGSAFDLKPDVIYLLTDGDFSTDVSQLVLQRNSTKIPIHTIALGSESGKTQLKKIADENQGTFRFVPLPGR